MKKDMRALKPGDKLEYVGPHLKAFEGWDIDPESVCTFQEYTYDAHGDPRFIIVKETPGTTFTWRIDEWSPAFEMPEEDVDLEALIERLAARHQAAQ